jgi:RNA polymerase sigma factor (sigma-70 family)
VHRIACQQRVAPRPVSSLPPDRRRLGAFEEYNSADERGGDWGLWRHWRTAEDVDDPFGALAWHCPDCGGLHDLPDAQNPLVCPRLPPDEARHRASGYVEKKLAKSMGQPEDVANQWQQWLAFEIIDWRDNHPAWGDDFLNEYLGHKVLGPLLHDLMTDDDCEGPPLLSSGQMKLVIDYEPLLQSTARKIAKTNAALLPHLLQVGGRVLDEGVREFDAGRGVTFGAFIGKRLHGAMIDEIQALRPEVGMGSEDEIEVLNKAEADHSRQSANSNAPKRHRTSTGGYESTSYVEREGRRSSAQRPRLVTNRASVGADVKAALARLKPKLRDAYQMWVLDDPRLPRSEVAKRLGVHETHVSRIVKQAERKMARLLKVTPPHR